MTSFRRVIWIVLDSVGIGEMPDAAAYGDVGSDTLGNIARKRPLYLPNFCALGLGNIKPLTGISPAAEPTGAYGRCALASPGKDTTTGHWEMVGIHLQKPFPVYPECFPKEIIHDFEERIGRKTLGNCPASGTEIIQRLGDEHVRTGSLIVYTSADSVFQIAAHEEVIPVDELYRICEIARDILRGDHEVGRVIARPFVGNLRPLHAHPEPSRLRGTAAARHATRSVARARHSSSRHREDLRRVSRTRDHKLRQDQIQCGRNGENARRNGATTDGLIYVNLVDFDQNFGHRNDVEGYAKALEEVDAWLPKLLSAAHKGDLIILTADHGCDPTTPSTDHSREYVPLLVHGGTRGVDLGTRSTLSDIGQTVAAIYGAEIVKGTSFLSQITV